MMMDVTTMSAGMMVAMVLVCLIILVFVVLGIAAFIKYLRS
jgi:Na+-transporting methylmalonyl-CoA/oxaloacetate decarboxylase gamma subunit